MNRPDTKDRGASEQRGWGGLKGMPDPCPKPAHRSLGCGEQPLPLCEGLSHGGQTPEAFHPSTKLWGLDRDMGSQVLQWPPAEGFMLSWRARNCPSDGRCWLS